MWCHGVDYGNIIMITTTTMIPLLPTTITSDDDNNNNNDNDNNNSENNKTFRRIVDVYGPRFAKIFCGICGQCVHCGILKIMYRISCKTE